MNDMLAGQLAELQKALAESREQMVAAHRALQALEVTVDSPDRSMRIRLSGSGELTQLEFRDDSYVEIGPRELADALTALFRAAQAKHREAVMAAAPEMPFSGMSLEALLDPTTAASDLLPEKIFGSLFSGAGGGPVDEAPRG